MVYKQVEKVMKYGISHLCQLLYEMSLGCWYV